MNYKIRQIDESEIQLLKDFLYEAVFQKDENNLIPRSVISEPEVEVYIKDFGKPDDLCLVAELDNKIIGAVWTRILCGEVKGFGNIDGDTPEFAISLYKEYRGIGIGTALMKDMLDLLKEKGYKKTSLSVQKENYAVKMYENVGFSIVSENEEDYLMVCDLQNE
ncbi:MAG: GNAT family N-acetyltransferase [Oscillospiraceae bacterium]|nr:GNAT family N-acetyltransferase [Oscillospiraceae bacterium]